MTEMIALHIFALFAGSVLGALFFAGLWWTVKRGVSSPQPALLFLASMLLRTLIVLLGFYVVGNGHLSRLLACLLGFIIARFIIMRITDEEAKTQLPARRQAREGDHAPES